MAILNVNTDATIALTAKLEKMSRSAFPNAVRNTLNNAAFDTKKHLPFVANKKFVTRQKTFFKRFSTIQKAVGFNVSSMKSQTGINPNLDRQLADNLEAQEHGGVVQGKKLIPHDHSRVSQKFDKRVKSRNFLNKVKAHDATKAYRAHRGSRRSKFVAAVMGTVKSGKRQMLLESNSRGMVYEVSSVSQNRMTRKVVFKLKKLYTVRRVRTHTVSASNFMSDSGKMAAKDMPNNYVKNAEFQFKKYLR